jgi:hypothetical protein
MRTNTNGASERRRFDLAQRVVLWLGSQSYTRKSRTHYWTTDSHSKAGAFPG